MTNVEKYLKENANVDEFVTNLLHECNCPREDLEEFLNKEVKPILLKDERVILGHRPLDTKYIGRDSLGLYVSQWDNRTGGYCYWEFSNAFDFIKVGEEYKISDLLKEE